METQNSTQNTPQKKFEELKNIGLISVVRYEKNILPDVILGNFIQKIPEKIIERKLFFKKILDNPDLPVEVSEFFKNFEKDTFSLNGLIYKKITDAETGEISYDCYDDFSKKLSGVLELREIDRIVYSLENSVGKLIRTSDLVNLPGFKPIQSEFGEVYIDFSEDKLVGHNLRECKVTLSISNGSSYTFDLGYLVYFVYRR